MKSNYEPLGKHIRLVDYRNSEEVTSTVLGISIDKEFIPSVANVIGTDLSRYKLISKGLFACNPMHVGRDERLPIALYEKGWCCTIKVDIENSKGQYIEKDKQEATKDGSESTKIQHGI